MSHPKNRAERRHQRERVIAARRFIYLHIWNSQDFEFMREVSNPLIDILAVFEKWKNARDYEFFEYPDWGKYAKWNLNCSCKRCRGRKSWERMPSKRRRKLKTADSDWEWQYSED